MINAIVNNMLILKQYYLIINIKQYNYYNTIIINTIMDCCMKLDAEPPAFQKTALSVGANLLLNLLMNWAKKSTIGFD